MIIVKQYFNES